MRKTGAELGTGDFVIRVSSLFSRWLSVLPRLSETGSE